MIKRNCNVFVPPKMINKQSARLSIFLAGSIEMGTCENWQETVIEHFDEKYVDFYNPRRVDWDASWSQGFEQPQFYQQVAWEMDSLDFADVVVFYFDPKTKSPISLLELGLYKDKNPIVCVPEGYWRKGNIEMVCNKYELQLCHDMESFMTAIASRIHRGK